MNSQERNPHPVLARLPYALCYACVLIYVLAGAIFGTRDQFEKEK